MILGLLLVLVLVEFGKLFLSLTGDGKVAFVRPPVTIQVTLVVPPLCLFQTEQAKVNQ